MDTDIIQELLLKPAREIVHLFPESVFRVFRCQPRNLLHCTMETRGQTWKFWMFDDGELARVSRWCQRGNTWLREEVVLTQDRHLPHEYHFVRGHVPHKLLGEQRSLWEIAMDFTPAFSKHLKT